MAETSSEAGAGAGDHARAGAGAGTRAGVSDSGRPGVTPSAPAGVSTSAPAGVSTSAPAGVSTSAPAGTGPSAEILLRATGLTRRFGGLAAVNAVSIDLRRGEVHAVIGTNGAGKSTLINMLSGEMPPSDGEIHLGSHAITAWSQPRRARAGIGRSYQRTNIFEALTVFENTRLSAQAAQQRAWRVWESASACERSGSVARQALAATGLTESAGRVAGALSHGGKRQLEIAMCLATQPRVLLLDEPLAGMGAEETERMLALLAEIRRDHAVLLVEHDMDAVFRIADRITVMVNGQVIATDVPERIRVNPDVRTAYLGEGH